MTTRKRPATNELMSFVQIHEADQLPISNDMNLIQSLVSCAVYAKERLTAWWSPQSSVRADQSHASTDGVEYIQTSEARIDNTSLKRRRIHREAKTTATATARARSADETFRRSGRGQMDSPIYSSRKTLDEFFRPPEHALLKRAASGFLRPAPSSPSQTPSSDQHTESSSFRRHSDSSETPLDSASLASSTEPFDLYPRITPPKPLRYNKPQTPKFASRATSNTPQLDLDNRLKNLLLDGGEPANTPSKLHASSSKQAELAERHKQREIKRAEEIRLEEKRKADLLKKLERERLERESQVRLRRRLPNKALVQPLNSKWEALVNESFNSNNMAKVVTTSIGGIELAVKDFKTLLNQKSWLNDEIINAYLEWVVDAANKTIPENAPVGKEKPVPKLIAHNSFFYETLTKKGPSSTDRLMKRKGAGGKSLLQVDTLFVPICRGSHWTVGAVRPVAKTIEYFDSFDGHGGQFIDQMRMWLKHQLGDAYVASEWKEPRTGCASQSNGWDCGVFVCTNAFCVAFGLETSCYLERDMEYQRKRIAALLINRGFHGEFSWSNGGL